MKWIDSDFQGNGRRYVVQSVLAGLSVGSIVMALDVIGDPAIVASLGASAFILFVMPSRTVAQPKNVLFGYAIGILSGMLSLLVADMLPLNTAAWDSGLVTAVFGGIGVGVAVFGMASLDFEHPPAAGMALAFVLGGNPVISGQTWLRALVAVGGVAGLVIIQQLLRKHLMDLL